MRLLFLVGLFSFALAPAFSTTPQTDSLLIVLNQTLENREQYIQEKLKRIDRYRDELKSKSARNPELEFQLLDKLSTEYETFVYDSAFTYIRKLQHLAYKLNDPVKIAHAKIKLGFILISSGMFKETLDSLGSLNVRTLPDSSRMKYYFILARTYYDLGDFDKDVFYTPYYNDLGNLYIDSAKSLCTPESYTFVYLSGLKNLKNENNEEALKDLNRLLDEYKLTPHELAVTASTLSYFYITHNQPDEAIHLLAQAAIADIKSATKETSAMSILADLLYKKGDISNAYVYIQQAMEDALFYGARQRKIQVGAILPLIAAEKLHNVEAQRRIWLIYSSAITLLSVLVVVFAWIIYKQVKKLRRTQKALLEANRIKEEYIGFYFNVNSEYLNKAESLKTSIEHKLMTKKIEEIKFLVNNFNLKKDREDLFINFDKIFLKLFPDFVTTFNSYFKDEDKIVLKEGQLLNTELRIFALIRMGIHDTEKIAKILDYSINTIYNYKARIKGKSIVPNDQFEQKIMEISAVEPS
jgi:DNA-binding CsgD family transcriptional regulator